MIQRTLPTTLRCTLLAAMATILAGCNASSDGPPRYQVSGTATLNGQPIPVGEVSLTPDTDKGNSGPGSVARIVDGKYQTESGMGVVGGPYTVSISAFDGVPVGESTEGTPLLQQPHKESVEFEKQDSVKDFAITK